ncbi:MAG: hypothetical protein ACYTGH_19800, partial [Planctomycetota bacterium]
MGPYYWVSLSFARGGRIKVGGGETSPKGLKLKGRWAETKTGMTGEIFVPYSVMNVKAWPASRDLGFSAVWNHHHSDGRRTRLVWSEDAHEWNPRWYGVIRR